MHRRQFLLAVPCGALLPSLASAQEPGRVYRMAVISPSERRRLKCGTSTCPSLPGSASLWAATTPHREEVRGV